MVTEIPKYDNVKTRLSRTAEVVGTEQNPEDNSKIVFPEDVLLLPNNSSFLLIDHTDGLQKIILVFGWKYCEYLLGIRTCPLPPLNGSFNNCPRQFAQLYSLHVDLGSTPNLNYEYPIVFAHLPDKK